jgi:hypothetical protein
MVQVIIMVTTHLVGYTLALKEAIPIITVILGIFLIAIHF